MSGNPFTETVASLARSMRLVKLIRLFSAYLVLFFRRAVEHGERSVLFIVLSSLIRMMHDDHCFATQL